MGSPTAFFDDPGELLNESSMVDRFIEYVKTDTASDEKSVHSPSTDNQRRLAEKLVTELRGLAVRDATVDETAT
jgi:tripeptide aminopeptidase